MANGRTVMRQIAAAPDRWRILERDVRRCLTKVFPYAVLYTIDAGPVVLIVAVSAATASPDIGAAGSKKMPNHTVQRTGASQFAQAQIARPRRLAPVADLGVRRKHCRSTHWHREGHSR